MKTTLRWFAIGMAVALLPLGLGCTSAYYGPDDRDAPDLRVWPENRDNVARNAAVFVEVIPSWAEVTGFELVEVYEGRYYTVDCAASKRSYANEYLFCPSQVLASHTRYEVWLEVDNYYEYEWSFDTTGHYEGNPDDCYYVEPWSADGVKAKSVRDAGDFEAVTVPGRDA